MAVKDAKILILCKTYPSPSGKYVETSCVAGMDEKGNLIRLFPVPFRLITKDQQFKKWQWIDAKIEKASKDRRSESYTIKVDTIKIGNEVSTKNEWAERRSLITKIQIHSDFTTIEQERINGGRTLALLKPTKILDLEIVTVPNPNWTDDELGKLEQEQKQAGLFDSEDKPSIQTLRKLPHDFYYTYECDTPNGKKSFKHKIVDWEVGALYWRCLQNYGKDWQTQFRGKLAEQLPRKDLMFLMGNMHRFQDQWLIISIIYPPHVKQGSLF